MSYIFFCFTFLLLGVITVRVTWIPGHKSIQFNDLSDKSKVNDFVTLSNAKEVAAVSDGELSVTVHDTGAGMTCDQLDRVFDLGVQFNVNALQAGQGSGLGMWIAKEIASLHHGTLTAKSDGIGRGSEFTMVLPLYHIKDEDLPESLQSFRVRSSSGSDGQGASTDSSNQVGSKINSFEPLRLLVVDDVASNRKLLRRLLERRGHICEEANDGYEAVVKVLGDKSSGVLGQQFDSILMDSEMPVMSGPIAVQKLRQAGCDCFIVGVTGNVLAEDITEFKSCGANEVLHKPIDMTLLEALWMEYGVGGMGNSKRLDSKVSSISNE